MKIRFLIANLIIVLFSHASFAEMDHHPMKAMDHSTTVESHHHPIGPSDCSEMEVWDFSMGTCMPLAMAGMPMKMAMFHYNAFFTQTAEEGPRGRNGFAIPNMFMADVGSSVGDRQYVNLDFMGTLERWTFPKDGYPELLQIGEENQDHQPFIDAQHPHSSPIMGLTLSDTITLGNGKDHAKIWFAPRGQSTDGPVAFMHRPTGMVNPDAPLGHHIGQDVGHISSTVIGASVQLNNTALEVSTFNGKEPEPTKVDLPIATPNSYAAGVTQVFTPQFYGMISAAFVKNSEAQDPLLDHIWRYSTSIYNDRELNNGWMFHNALIYGLINFYDNTAALNSLAEEFWFHKDAKNIWGRIEHVQRTAEELQISSPKLNDPKWVTAVTLGYTHKIAKWDSGDLGVGVAVTKDILPSEFQSSYGGNPFSGKIFLQLGGMKMWDL